MAPIDSSTAFAVALALIAGAIGLLALRLVSARRKPNRRAVRVIGVGSAGARILSRLASDGPSGADFVAANTDAEALQAPSRARKLQLGASVTRGLGAGGDASVGERAAKEDEVAIGRTLAGSDIVLVLAGLGGGTGSGAAPVIASIAKDQGALTIGVVTKPFSFEGSRRAIVANDAAAELRSKVDALVIVRNDRVRDFVPENSTMLDAFRLVDDALRQMVNAIVEIPAVRGFINLGLADVRAVLKDGGAAVMGVGRAEGENRAVEAARQAVAANLLEDGIDGATRVLMNIRGSANLRLDEVTGAADVIRAAVDPQANMVFGANIDESLGDQIQVTVIASGFETTSDARRAERRAEYELQAARAGIAQDRETAEHRGPGDYDGHRRSRESRGEGAEAEVSTDSTA